MVAPKRRVAMMVVAFIVATRFWLLEVMQVTVLIVLGSLKQLMIVIESKMRNQQGVGTVDYVLCATAPPGCG